MEEKIYYSISQINDYIKLLFDNTSTLKNIYLKAEISNYKGPNKNGHIYFTLKDKNSSLNAVLFKFDSYSLSFSPKNGDEVIVFGSISSYPPSGTYQIICKTIQLFGIGEILLKKEELKKKLYTKGIFDQTHKLKLPLYPEKIAIITGKNSAAALDFEYNLKRRFPIVNVELFYSLVQGNDAPNDIVRNLNEAIKTKPNLIIIGRGGGASEDLEAFDDEKVVMAIYDSNIPIISAVGHEINKTFCDFVADQYASTPTGAAEIAVPNYIDIIDNLKSIDDYLISSMRTYLLELEHNLLKVQNNAIFKNQSSVYDIFLDKIKTLKQNMTDAINLKITDYSQELSVKKATLNALNPLNILSKGYALIKDKKGNIIYSKNEITINDDVEILFNDGSVYAEVKEKK